MSLNVTAKEQRVGVFVVSPASSIDSDTFSILEDRGRPYSGEFAV